MNEVVEIDCPWCGAMNSVPVDDWSGSSDFVTDCENCCRPMTVRLDVQGGDISEVDVEG